MSEQLQYGDTVLCRAAGAWLRNGVLLGAVAADVLRDEYAFAGPPNPTDSLFVLTPKYTFQVACSGALGMLCSPAHVWQAKSALQEQARPGTL